ncbi:unnamed protein product [Staurois parvus]|uniref:Uncharacterized protein n=1 Tax=Staurois parvus TaxID=386267 RepID=A0ABN9A6U7_9NEOB|nr:unnamed protein product [Staurois parvus]
MYTDRWHCWGYTDHQGTLIISSLMISRREVRRAGNRHSSEGTCTLIIRELMISVP